MPPASSRTPDAGVTQALHRRIASTFFMAPANVAAASSGATYLRARRAVTVSCLVKSNLTGYNRGRIDSATNLKI